MGLKPLRPSLKEKKRYLVFEYHSKSKISPEELIQAINTACLTFMGTLHMSKAGVMVLKNQLMDNKGVIKVNHLYVDHLKASLQLITTIKKNEVNIITKGVSGILKKAREKFMIQNVMEEK